MAHNFRTAFNGFNKEDVVRYLEYIHTKHQNEVNQLHTEIEELRSRAAGTAPVSQAQPSGQLEEENRDLQAQVQALEARCAELTAKLEQKQEVSTENWESRELDAYRRAERIQKEAQDRAELVYFQANHVLSEVTTRVEGAAVDMTELTDRVMEQITQLQVAVSSGKQALQEAASVLGTIRPNR